MRSGCDRAAGFGGFGQRRRTAGPDTTARRRPEINKPTPHPSLRAQRSNPGVASRGPWIASSQELLAMTGEAYPSSRFGNPELTRDGAVRWLTPPADLRPAGA